jgi:hypothetical protein
VEIMSRLSLYKSIVPTVAIAATFIASAPVEAADMVTYVPPARTHVVRVHHPRVVHTAYLARPTNCDDRIVEYRDPYIPHTEIVRVCGHYRYRY